jgi:DNA adenine methylase
VVNDINIDLINTYEAIKHHPEDIISALEVLQQEYHSLDNAADREKEYYYHKRYLFNGRKHDKTGHSALFYFYPPYRSLSKTSNFNFMLKMDLMTKNR